MHLRPGAACLRLVLALVAAALVGVAAVPGADARVIQLGLLGDMDSFRRLTGQRTNSILYFPQWGTCEGWPRRDPSFFDQFGARPIVSLGMSKNGSEFLTPRQVARGAGDAHLLGLAIAAATSGKRFYVRPFAEMNGHWNSYSAYNANGTKRDAAHSQEWLKRAFRRVYLIMHGGTRAEISSRLRGIGLPGVERGVPPNPYPNMTVMWNPQGFGSPDVYGNRAQAYWPGRKYVDMVANDLYSRTGYVTWDANLELYRAHPKKPYAIGEWGLRGIDDAATVRRMAEFARTHRRVRLLVWFNGKPGSEYNLGSKPNSLRAYRRYIVPLNQ